MSSKPTTLPFSRTGRCLKWFSIIVPSASMAESLMSTHLGLGVITPSTKLEWSKCFATTRLTMSVSLTIPAKPPSAPTIRAASPLLSFRILQTSSTESLLSAIIGFLGRSLLTGVIFDSSGFTFPTIGIEVTLLEVLAAFRDKSGPLVGLRTGLRLILALELRTKPTTTSRFSTFWGSLIISLPLPSSSSFFFSSLYFRSRASTTS